MVRQCSKKLNGFFMPAGLIHAGCQKVIHQHGQSINGVTGLMKMELGGAEND